MITTLYFQLTLSTTLSVQCKQYESLITQGKELSLSTTCTMDI